MPRLHTAVALAPRFINHNQATKPHQSASTRARKLQAPRVLAPAPMALLSDDGDFYTRAGITWLLSATIAVEILWGWIRGHRLRSKLFHFMVLVYGMRLGRHALKLRTFLANIPESRRFRCPGPVGVPSVGDCILMEGGYIRDLEQVATSSFHLMMVVVVLVIWKKRGPPRPRVPGWGGVGTIFIEILLFALCVLTCLHSLPVLILDYMAATANRGDAAAA